jgi:hypothetical protein
VCGALSFVEHEGQRRADGLHRSLRAAARWCKLVCELHRFCGGFWDLNATIGKIIITFGAVGLGISVITVATGTTGEEPPEILRAGLDVVLSFCETDSDGNQLRVGDRKRLFVDGSRIDIAGFKRDLTDLPE